MLFFCDWFNYSESKSIIIVPSFVHTASTCKEMEHEIEGPSELDTSKHAYFVSVSACSLLSPSRQSLQAFR
jgi:hypothetical protein